MGERFGLDPYHILVVALGASLLVSCWLPLLLVQPAPNLDWSLTLIGFGLILLIRPAAGLIGLVGSSLTR